MTAFDRFQRILMSFLLSVGFFYGGYYFGKRGYEVEIKKNPPKVNIINKNPEDQEVDFNLFWEVWNTINDKYLERPVDTQKMIYGAISGMVSSLGDPYTSFLPPTINEAMTNALNGKYQGIGAEIGIRDGFLIIVTPLDGSPAKAAGLRGRDKILEIESESTSGLSVTDAVAKIRGKENTVVRLTIQTDVSEPRVVDITRGVITISSINWEDKEDGVAYMRISRFGGETNKEWTRAALEVSKEMDELDAIIVDVRGNPGGYLQSAVYIVEEFYNGAPAIYEENAAGEQKAHEARRSGLFKDVPAVFVLIDGGSASSSEIVAGALRDKKDATLIGTKSFGKGTIQDAEEFDDGSGVHITIAKWLTPNKDWVHKKGIEPDVVVEVEPEDFENNIDRQLEKAIELAKKI